jgi:hypothetical protein
LLGARPVEAGPVEAGPARFPPKWEHFGDKKSRQLNMLEHVLVGKVLTLCRNML